MKEKVDTGDLQDGGERKPTQGTDKQYCVCPKCGYKTEKKSGICSGKKCPKCKVQLVSTSKKSADNKGKDFFVPQRVINHLKTRT